MAGRHRVRLFPALLALALIGAACASERTPSPEPSGTTTAIQQSAAVGYPDAPTGFNVHLPSSSSAVTRDLVGLVWPSAYRIGPDGSAEPWLLAGPASVVSTDPFVVEWRIRADARWSDGTPVTVDDLEFLYRQCAGLDDEEADGAAVDAGCVERDRYHLITRFERVDTKTARTEFERPLVEFESLFSAIPPSHVAIEDGGGWGSAFATDPGPSAGPFSFVERQGDGSLVFERNDEYFGEDPRLDRLVIRFVGVDGRIGALRSGDVDVVETRAELASIEALEGMPDARPVVGAGRAFVRVVFNLDQPMLRELGARRAVALGIDQQAVLSSLVTPVHPQARPLSNRAFVVGERGYEAHGAALTSEAAERVERAQGELLAAGFESGADGVFTFGGTPFEVRLSTVAGDVVLEQVAQLLQAQLADVGVRVTIDNAADAELRSRLEGGDFDLALVRTSPEPFPVARLAAAYGTGGTRNWSGLSDERVDELLAAASAETNRDLRSAALNDLDSVLWDLLPDVPLFQPPFVLGISNRLSGVVPNPTSQGHLWNVEEWSVSSTTP